MNHPRIAVTGLGAVTPFGVGVPVLWENIIAGRSATAFAIEDWLRELSPVVAQLRDFDAGQHLAAKPARDLDRVSQMALIAAREAIADAGYPVSAGALTFAGSIPGDRVGVSVGTAFGGMSSYEDGVVKRAQGRSGRVGPRLVSRAIPNAPAGAITRAFSITGPALTYATACASGAHAIGEAWHALRRGDVDLFVAGASEYLFVPTLVAGLRDAGALALHGPADAARWSRPFDVMRAGMVMGEGAAMVVLEPLAHALARGARVYALLDGYGASNDAWHETAPHPAGAGAVHAMQRALASANMTPAHIDYVNAHATATIAGDRSEALALATVFGEHLKTTPVSSVKGAIGHMLGASGAVEAVICAKAIETLTLPPTINCDAPEEGMPPDIVPTMPRQTPALHSVLSNSFGFGGQNGALILSRHT
jgi:3-oxoacyl-[acyl-carrier-protein] synthase II